MFFESLDEMCTKVELANFIKKLCKLSLPIASGNPDISNFLPKN